MIKCTCFKDEKQPAVFREKTRVNDSYIYSGFFKELFILYFVLQCQFVDFYDS